MDGGNRRSQSVDLERERERERRLQRIPAQWRLHLLCQNGVAGIWPQDESESPPAPNLQPRSFDCPQARGSDVLNVA